MVYYPTLKKAIATYYSDKTRSGGIMLTDIVPDCDAIVSGRREPSMAEAKQLRNLLQPDMSLDELFSVNRGWDPEEDAIRDAVKYGVEHALMDTETDVRMMDALYEFYLGNIGSEYDYFHSALHVNMTRLACIAFHAGEAFGARKSGKSE